MTERRITKKLDIKICVHNISEVGQFSYLDSKIIKNWRCRFKKNTGGRKKKKISCRKNLVINQRFKKILDNIYIEYSAGNKKLTKRNLKEKEFEK